MWHSQDRGQECKGAGGIGEDPSDSRGFCLEMAHQCFLQSHWPKHWAHAQAQQTQGREIYSSHGGRKGEVTIHLTAMQCTLVHSFGQICSLPFLPQTKHANKNLI